MGTASDIVTAGGTDHVITVEYMDDVAVDSSDIDSIDMMIVGPDLTAHPVTFLTKSSDTDVTPITATYQLSAPGGTWDIADNGIYTILAGSGEVTDTSENPIAGGLIGSFQVNIPTAMLGDFDGDGDLDCDDANALTTAIATSSTDLQYDVTGDGFVTNADLDEWILNIKQTLFGDANLDFSVDGSDFNQWNANKFSTTSEWCGGDFNADGLVDGSDFSIWNSNKFQMARPTSPFVPDIAGLVKSLSAARRPHAAPTAVRESVPKGMVTQRTPAMLGPDTVPGLHLAGSNWLSRAHLASGDEPTQGAKRHWDEVFASWE
jgi:hypothetical protein